MPWSEYMPLGSKDIKNKKGVSPLTLKKSVDGKAVVNTIGGDSWQQTYSGKNLFDVNDTNTVSTECSLDEDGWISVSYDNSAGTSTVYKQYYTNPSELLVESTSYAIAVEIKEMTACEFALWSNTDANYTMSQFTGKQIITEVGTYIYVATSQSSFDACEYMLRSYVSIAAGASASIKFRISVLADTSVTADTFIYEPYCGGMASPNPDYPQEIESVGGNGWFDGKWVSGYMYNGTLTASTNWVTSENKIPCKENDVIELTHSENVNQLRITFYTEDSTFISQVDTTYAETAENQTNTATAPSTAKWFDISVRNNSGISINTTAKTVVTINGQYATRIKTVGKNLLRNTASSGTGTTSEGVTFTVNEDGSVTMNGTSTGTTLRLDFTSPVPQGELIASLSNDDTSARLIIGYFKEDGTAVNEVTRVAQTESTFTFPDDAATMRVYLSTPADTTYDNVTVYPMIRKADVTDATYQPYTSSTITIQLTEPLRAIGDVKDEICIQDGKYGVLRRIGEHVLDGSVAPYTITALTNCVYVLYSVSKLTENHKSLCDNLKYLFSYGSDSQHFCVARNGNIAVWLPISVGTTNEAIATYFSEKPYTIIGELATPVFEPFDDQTVFNDLSSADGVTYVSIEGLSDNLSPEMNVYYPGSNEGNSVMSLIGGGSGSGDNQYLKFDANAGGILAMDDAGEWVLVKATTLPMPHKFYIYKTGTDTGYKFNLNTYRDAHGNGTLDTSGDYMTLSTQGTGYNYPHQISISTSDLVDTTGFKYLSFELELSSTVLNNVAVGIFSTSPSGSYTLTVPTIVKAETIPAASGMQIVTVDVSEHQGLFYVGVYDGTTTTTLAYIYHKNIYLHN